MSLHLQHIIGASKSAVDYHHTGFGWLAGGRAVLSLVTSGQIIVSSRQNRPLNCLAFSPCGGYIALGEGGCTDPEVQLFDISSGEILWWTTGHKEAVGSIIFSNQGLLASLGLHDSTLQVYDVRTGQVLVKHNLKSSGIRACFTEDGSSVVTCGKGHFKSWSISHKAGSPSPYLNEKPVSLPKDFRSSSFVSVKSAVTTSSSTAPPSSGGVYALTSDGTLLLMRATGRSLSHHVSLQVSKAFDLAVSEGLVAAACEAGLVRVFASKTLQYQTSLPRPSAYSAADEEAYPDAVSVSFSPSDGRSLAVAYSDHSIIVYNVANCKKVSHVRVLSSHAGGIFAIKSSLDLLATASSDGSIKIWKSQGLVGPQHAHSLRGPRSQQRSTHNRPAAIKTQPLVKKGAIGQVCWTRDPSVRGDIQKKEREVSGIATGVCCLDISSDGSLLAAGDERGNIQVFDLRSMTLIITRDQVHDGRVQSISLSSDKRFLASGGRDGLIHLFQLLGSDLILADTVDDHGAHSVTGLVFNQDTTRLISCGSDRSFIARSVSNDCALSTYFHDQLPPLGSQDNTHKSGGAFLDLALDTEGRLAVIASSDGTLRLYDIVEARALGRVALQSASVAVRVVLDASGTIAFCSFMDGSIHSYYLPDGSLIAMSHGGHSGVASSLILAPDLTSLTSVGGDGVMLQWMLPNEVRRISQPQPRHDTTPLPDVSKSNDLMVNTLMRVKQGKPLLSHDKLPKWARPTIPSSDLPQELPPQATSADDDVSHEAPTASDPGPGPDLPPQETKKMSFIQRVLGLRLKSKKNKAIVKAPAAEPSLAPSGGAEKDQSLKVVGRSMSICKMEEIPEEGPATSEGGGNRNSSLKPLVVGAPSESGAQRQLWIETLDDDQVELSSPLHEPSEFSVKACEDAEMEEPLVVSVAGSNSVSKEEEGEMQYDSVGEASIILPPRDLFKEHYLHQPEPEMGRPSEAASISMDKVADPRRQSLSSNYRQLALSILKDARRKQQAEAMIIQEEADGAVTLEPEVIDRLPVVCPQDLPVTTPVLRQSSPQRRAGRLEADLARMRERLQSLNKKWDKQAKKAEKPTAAELHPDPVPAPALGASSLDVVNHLPTTCGLSPADAEAVHPPTIAPLVIQGQEPQHQEQQLQDNPMFNSSTPLSTYSLTPPPKDGLIFPFGEPQSSPAADKMDKGDLLPRVLMENAAFISVERGGGGGGGGGPAPMSPHVSQDRGRPLTSPEQKASVECSPSNFQLAKRARVSNKLPPFKRSEPLKTTATESQILPAAPTPLTEHKTRPMQKDADEVDLQLESIEFALSGNDLPHPMDQDAAPPDGIELSLSLDRLHLAALETTKLWAGHQSEDNKVKLRTILSVLQALT